VKGFQRETFIENFNEHFNEIFMNSSTYSNSSNSGRGLAR